MTLTDAIMIVVDDVRVESGQPGRPAADIVFEAREQLTAADFDGEPDTRAGDAYRFVLDADPTDLVLALAAVIAGEGEG